MTPPLSYPVAPKRLPPPSRRQRSSSFPQSTRSHAHRCSRLTRQYGGEQSGLVLVFLGLSILDLGPMYATYRQTQTDVRQTDKCQTSDKSVV